MPYVKTDIATRALVVTLKAPHGGAKTTPQIHLLTGIPERTINKIYSRAIERGFEPNECPLKLIDAWLEDGSRSGRPSKQTDENRSLIIAKRASKCERVLKAFGIWAQKKARRYSSVGEGSQSVSPSPATLDTLLSSFWGSEIAADSEEKCDTSLWSVRGRRMATQATSPPAGVPLQNGINGAKSPNPTIAHPYGQTPVPLPSYAPTSRSASVASAPTAQKPSASPAPTTPFLPPGHHQSPSMQTNHLNQTISQHSQTQILNAPSQAQGLMSPTLNQLPHSVESSNHYHELTALVEKTPADIVRQVVRDKWEKSLAGSQYHIAFLLNATMHQASPETIAKAVQEFGASLVQKSKRELLGHLNASDFDEVADLILPRVSTQFLDRALARRLETIPARQLVNALARAERLGYDVKDIVQEHNEHVIPSLHSLPVQPQPQPMEPRTNTALSARQYHTPPVASQTLPPPMQYVNEPATQTPTKYPSELPGLVWCKCGWPCASQAALDYHHKKSACNRIQANDVAGRDICLFCGCKFGSGGGLLYHEKSNVCGNHARVTAEMMRKLLLALRPENPQPPVPDPSSQITRIPYTQVPLPPIQPQTTWAHSTTSYPTGTPSRDSGRDPYAHLSPEDLKRFNDIMKSAEAKYGGLMKDAMLLNEPERSKRLASLKNSYNTKQSTTRKKFGIRLRERRTRGEIEAEEARLMGTPSGTATPPATATSDGDIRSRKRARTDDDQSPSSSATNRTQESPQKRVPVSEMGGLSGSSATAELTDPTAYLNPTQPRYAPPKTAALGGQARVFGSAERTRPSMGGTLDDPMSIHDDDNSETDSDSDSDSDGDIPATIS
ncbi:hypothetical protein FoTM2_000936 [Fusarium oxysporum f. sp. vasinfectum]|nr:hypothetical protein FoTM2_000936 [Fusarium oxysporum f. sp. vasinfectum]